MVFIEREDKGEDVEESKVKEDYIADENGIALIYYSSSKCARCPLRSLCG